MMTNGDPEGQIFLSNPHTNNAFSCSPLNTASLYFKKRFPEGPEYAEMRQSMVTSL